MPLKFAELEATLRRPFHVPFRTFLKTQSATDELPYGKLPACNVRVVFSFYYSDSL